MVSWHTSLTVNPWNPTEGEDQALGEEGGHGDQLCSVSK